MATGPAPKKQSASAVDEWETVTPTQQSDEWETVSGPSTPAKKPLPLPPGDLTGAAAGLVYGDFLPQIGKAAKKDVSSGLSALKQKAEDAFSQLKSDPSSIVPMWFGTLTGALEAGGKTVAAPVEALAGGNGFDALSLAAGGDPTAAREYAAKGDNGGEFWEMLGKPLALVASGEVAGRAGGAISGALAGRASDASLALMRDVVLRGSLDKTGVDMAEVQLARDAMQDAAQDMLGPEVKSTQMALKQLAPKRSFLSPVATPEMGNKRLLTLSRRAVDLAGEPADRVNSVFGYMDGRQSAQNIRADLLSQAEQAERNGAHSYADSLRSRASAFDRLTHRGTLGDIYAIKKTANRLSDVARNTQEAIDLMDSYSAMASAIRREVYPIYERNIETMAPGQGFSMRQAGRKEGAAMSFRNGLEKSWRDAQERTGQIYRSGKPSEQVARGMSPRHATTGLVGRVAEKLGIWPNPQGSLNRDVVRGIGKVPAGQVRESLEVSRPAQFSGVPPTAKALPGKVFTFKIPAGLPVERQEGEIALPGRKRHIGTGYELRKEPTLSDLPPLPEGETNTRNIRKVPKYQYLTDVKPDAPAPRSDVVGGGGMLETPDPRLAEETLEHMKASLRKNPRQPELRQAISNLEGQLDQYWEGQRLSEIRHTPPTMTYKPRQPAPKKRPVAPAVRRSLPAALAGWQREGTSGQNPTDAWQNPQ